jgi:hypothetical protein
MEWRLANALPDFFGTLPETIRVAPAEYNQKFLTAIAAHPVIRPHEILEACRQLLQHFIAD